LYKGVLRINPHNRNDAYVTVEGLDQDVYIDGYIHRNRALEGDTVVVELVDKSQWKTRKTAKEEEVEELVEELLDDEQIDNDKRSPDDIFLTGKNLNIMCNVWPWWNLPPMCPFPMFICFSF
jgi:hypothetical protein